MHTTLLLLFVDQIVGMCYNRDLHYFEYIRGTFTRKMLFFSNFRPLVNGELDRSIPYFYVFMDIFAL